MNANFTKWGLLLCSIWFFCSCKESTCDTAYRSGGPEYCSMYVYKFMEGKDYSDHVIVISPLRKGDSSAYYITGYEPIKLHGGYYLGGNIPALHDPEMIYYLTFTYSDLESGNVEEEWLDHWWDYRILPQECIFEWFYYYGRCSCVDARCNYRNSPYYNPNVELHVPIVDDVHTDTSLINAMIDGNNLRGFYNFCAPLYCFECDNTKSL